MRTDKEMFDQLLSYAGDREEIRAVYMNGSRTNPMVPKDIFQDFDIVYVVTETEPFIRDKSWITYFGEMAVMQEPDNPALFKPERDRREAYGYLMQFADGNRIDLTFQTIEVTKENYLSDKLTLPLLDKDHILPPIPEPSDEDYHVKRPQEGEYLGCCNEFWWVSTYIAKGLWRGELLFAMDHLNHYVRPMLLKMLEWNIGVQTGFSLSVGKNGKYMDKHMDQKTWKRLLDTYPAAEKEAMWESLSGMYSLFSETAREVADKLDFCYNIQEEEGTRAYIKKVRCEL